MFNGNGTISVGGGDELWLYINKILVIQLIANPDDEDLPCRMVDIAPASNPGKWILAYLYKQCHHSDNAL